MYVGGGGVLAMAHDVEAAGAHDDPVDDQEAALCAGIEGLPPGPVAAAGVDKLLP